MSDIIHAIGTPSKAHNEKLTKKAEELKRREEELAKREKEVARREEELTEKEEELDSREEEIRKKEEELDEREEDLERREQEQEEEEAHQEEHPHPKRQQKKRIFCQYLLEIDPSKKLYNKFRNMWVKILEKAEKCGDEFKEKVSALDLRSIRSIPEMLDEVLALGKYPEVLKAAAYLTQIIPSN
jgi:chromosome segregation ATPase